MIMKEEIMNLKNKKLKLLALLTLIFSAVVIFIVEAIAKEGY